MQPSSATVERGFSVLEYQMNSRQGRSKTDLICASVMLRFNNRKRGKGGKPGKGHKA